MNRRGWIWLGGSATAAMAVAVGVATNQVLDNGRLSWPWLVIALAIALVTVVLGRRMGERDSDLELTDVTLTQTGTAGDTSAVLDLKLRNIGGQPAIIHRATFHIHGAVSLSPYPLVGFLPYEELWVRGALLVSETYDLALPDPEQAAGSEHLLGLSQSIEPAGTDRFHIRLGIPPTQDTLVYLLQFDVHYDARRTLTSPAIAIAHPPGSRLVTPDEIRRDLHSFRRAVRDVRDAIDQEMTAQGMPTPDWDNDPPTSRADLPAGLLAVDGDAGNPIGADPGRGIYEVNDAFWDPAKSITQRLHDIHAYCSQVISVITGADVRHDSLPDILTQAQAILAQLPSLRADFSAPQNATIVQHTRGTPDIAGELLRLLDGQPLQELHARASSGEADAAGQLRAATALIDKIRRLDADHPEALHARESLIFWLVARDKPGAAAALAKLIPDQVRVQGPDHPRTLQARHYLAMCRGDIGDAEAAATAFAELVHDRQRVLGPDHPDTLDSRHELARWRAMAGDPAAAVSAFVELVAERTRVQGADHPDTLHARHNLAVCLGKTGNFATAATALADVVADRIRVLGPAHRHTISSQREWHYWQVRAGESPHPPG